MYYTITGSLKSYLQNMFDYSSSEASGLSSTFTCLVYMSPLVGAFMADYVLGRFKSILLFACIYTFGIILCGISTYPSINSQSLFLFSLYCIITLGAGGLKPNTPNFGKLYKCIE